MKGCKKWCLMALMLLMIFALIPRSVLIAAPTSVTQTVSSSPGASGTWTDSISPAAASGLEMVNLSISGTWVAIVYLQRSYDGGSNWYDVQSWTANTEEQIFDSEDKMIYRIGVKNGGYTSGSVVLRMGRQ